MIRFLLFLALHSDAAQPPESPQSRIVPTPDGGSATKILVDARGQRTLYTSLYFSWPFVLHDGRRPRWAPSVPPSSAPGTKSIYANASFSDVYVWMPQYPTPGDAIFHSIDHAVSWTPIPSPTGSHDLHAFAVSNASPPVIYYATDTSIFSSSDDGRTWNRLVADFYATVIVTPGSSPATIFAFGSRAGASALLRSSDSGLTWDELAGAPLSPETEEGIAFDPTNDATMYVGSYGGVFKSTDRGSTWSVSRNGLPQLFPAVSALAIDPRNPSRLIALAYNLGGDAAPGLYESLDAGATWLSFGRGGPTVVNCIFIDPKDDAIVYVGTALDGVVRTTDGGRSWSAFDEGISNAPVGFTAVPRYSRFGLTVLDDGTALLSGGDAVGDGSGPVANCEIFDPWTNEFRGTSTMGTEREDHVAIRLKDGRVLVAGGICCTGDGFLRSSEIYDPVARTWHPAADMGCPRIDPMGALLPDGRVFVIGGEVCGGNDRSIGEIFDPVRNVYTQTSSLPVSEFAKMAVGLSDGSVLVTVGYPNFGAGEAFLYDYSTDTWLPTGPMAVGLTLATASRLNDGRVLFVDLGSAEIFDPVNRMFTLTGKPLAPLAFSYPASATLVDGRVYVCCGDYYGEASSIAEIYDPARGEFQAGPETALQRSRGTPLGLPDGRVLIVGGFAQYLFEAPEIQAEEFLPEPAPVANSVRVAISGRR
jgi:photosystem II stability/assembly factor-like uncharacterized protein